MELPTALDVIASIDAFLVRHGMAASRFGAEATGDANLVADLRKGRSPRLDRLHRIATYMARIDDEAAGDHALACAPSALPSSSGNGSEISGGAR